jgi:hypothetical protein
MDLNDNMNQRLTLQSNHVLHLTSRKWNQPATAQRREAMGTAAVNWKMAETS